MKVAILIDEYDAPLQHSWKTPEHDGCTEVYREVFAILKADDEYERLVFITGTTKFTQFSLFSSLNNLTNISFFPEYADICGLTEKEIDENFKPELERMAEVNGWTLQQIHDKAKNYYGGYHFSHRNMVDVHNPFSLIKALDISKLNIFLAASGATSLLHKFVEDLDISFEHFNHCYIDSTTLETCDVSDGGSELFLYQSGYLTIKEYEDGVYTLGFPNEEAKDLLGQEVGRIRHYKK